MHKTSAAVIAAAILLCSCTAGTFTKPGSTQAEFKSDMYACDRDAMTAGLGQGLASLDMRQECMEAKGYTLQ
jgi:hypothetical protein